METKGHDFKLIEAKGVVKAVFSMEEVLIGICQYPLAKSRVDMTFAAPTLSKISSTRGLITPAFNISSTSFFIASLCEYATRYAFWGVVSCVDNMFYQWSPPWTAGEDVSLCTVFPQPG